MDMTYFLLGIFSGRDLRHYVVISVLFEVGCVVLSLESTMSRDAWLVLRVEGYLCYNFF